MNRSARAARLVVAAAVFSVVQPRLAAAQEADAGVDAGDDDLESRVRALEAQLAQLHAASAPDAGQAAEDTRESAENAAELTGAAQEAPEPYTFGGYVEALYQWNFGEPSNGITNLRGFDNRHDTFTVSNVVLDAKWDYENVVGRIALQIGHTPDSYYLAEPSRPGTPSVGATGAPLWKFIQEAYGGYRFPVGRGLLVQGGIFLSPIAPEGLPVKDNWNWSRSNLFFGLPFYHTGARASYPLTDEWTVTVALYNGWNSVVDNNVEKSVAAQVTYAQGQTFALSALYFGGVERPTGAPEGPYWRNLFDLYATWSPSSWLSLLAHFDAGFEPNRFGTSSWAGGAVYARVQPVSWIYVAARVDAFWEGAARGASGNATPLFWPVEWVASGTLTLDVRPHDRVSIRLEYRHDQAAGDAFFGGAVAGDGTTTPFVANRASQDTLTLGTTAWF